MSNIVRRKYRSPMQYLQDDVNSLFNSFWGSEYLGDRKFSINVDISEDKDGYFVHADIPGVEQKDIDVSVGHNYLTISAKRESYHKDKKHHTQECHYGEMQRTISLPDNVDTGKVEAKYTNGVLNLHIPKSEQHKPRKVDIIS